MDDREKKKLEKLNARYKKQNETIKENYDRVSVTLPKGTKERIRAQGCTINGYITKLILQDLERLEASNKSLRDDSCRSGEEDPF